MYLHKLDMICDSRSNKMPL